MSKYILIIDDEKIQAENLAKKLNTNFSQDDLVFEHYSTEDQLNQALETRFYRLAIIDVKLDGFSQSGIQLAKRMIDENPLIKILFVSSFKEQYLNEFNSLNFDSNIIGFLSKGEFLQLCESLSNEIRHYVVDADYNSIALANDTLLSLYEEAINQTNTNKKGILFERFLSILFHSIGFTFIQKRVKDSTSEIDLVIRNDINDPFLYKFGKYILVESKNEKEKINKDKFVLFRTKLNTTNQLAELGIIATSSLVAKTVKEEELRSSAEKGKVILLSRIELFRLIKSNNKLSEFKDIIDEQVRGIKHACLDS
jgi:response regulator receiver domain